MSKKRRQERVRVTGKDRVAKHESSGSIPFLNMPEGASLFAPKPGRMMLDILEYEVGEGNPIADPGTYYYERTFFTHRGIGPNNDSFICPAKTSGKRCPICEHRATLHADDGKAAEDLIKALKPTERQLFNLIDLKEPEKGVQLFLFSYFNFGKMLDAEIGNADEDDNWHNFADYDEGMTLRVSFAEDSFAGNTFCRAESMNFKARKTAYDADEMLEQVYCLDDIIKELPYKELKDIFLQNPTDDDDDDDAPAPRVRKRKAAPVADDDDEEEDDVPYDTPKKPARKPAPVDDDDDDDEEEEPAPKKKPARKKKPAPVEDDEDGDDDEDEPAPKKKPAKKKKAEEEGWDDFDDDGDDEEDEAPAPKKAAKKPAAKKKKAAPVEDDDDDDWDD